MNLKERLMVHEGIELKPYLDCCGKPWRECTCAPEKKGKLTIGVGRNLDDVGISQDEAMHLLSNDIAKAREDADTFYWFGNLDQPRQDVIVEMVFNLGLVTFREFKEMIKATANGNYHLASAEMMSSHWASQVGMRAVTLAKIMLSGEEE